MKNKIIILVASFALFVVLVFSQGLKTKKNYDTKDLIGKPIEEITLSLLNEKGFFSTTELKKNDFSLINFWASWCVPCRKEHKFLMELSKSKKLKIFGINFKDKPSSANKFINELGNPYYVITKDKEGTSSVSFGVYGIPESILVDKNLVVLKKYIGQLNDKDVKEILQIIESK